MVGVKKCCVCGTTEKKSAHISFHRFPAWEELRLKWIAACKLANQNTKSKFVCSKHFKDDDYEKTYWPRRRLIVGATPAPSNIYFAASTITPASTCVKLENPIYNPDLITMTGLQSSSVDMDIIKEEIKLEEPTTPTTDLITMTGLQSSSVDMDIVKEEVVLEDPTTPTTDLITMTGLQSSGVDMDIIKEEVKLEEPTTPTTDASVCTDSSMESSNAPGLHKIDIDQKSENISDAKDIGDLQLEHFSSPLRAKHHLDFVKDTVDEQRRTMRLLQKKNSRLEQRINKLTSLLDDLREEKLISNDAYATIMAKLKKNK